MKINFKVAKYSEVEGIFHKEGYKEYEITFLKSNKAHILRIVVCGFITKQTINLIDYKMGGGYKNQILKAVSDFHHKNQCNTIPTKKFLKLSNIQNIYNKNICRNIREYLLKINKEDSRDKLSEYNLVNI